jgi:hypothetical protein
MRFDDEILDSAYVRSVLEHARIRAMARRQLALSIPVVVAGACVAVISTFSFGHAAPPTFDQRGPINVPASSHSTMFCSADPRATNASNKASGVQMSEA